MYSGPRGWYLKKPGEFEGGPIEGTFNHTTPLTSPDRARRSCRRGRDVELVKVPVRGGPPETIAVSPERIFGADWGIDDSIVFGTRTGLFRVLPGTTTPTPLTTSSDPPRDGHLWPAFAGSSGLVLFALGNDGDFVLAAVKVSDGQITNLRAPGSAPRYLDTGHIVYATADGVLRAVPFDPSRIAVTGPSVPLESGVRFRPDYGMAEFDISEKGTLAFVEGEEPMRVPVLVDRGGAESPMSIEPGSYTFPRFSSTGDRLVLGNWVDRNQDLWMWEFTRPGLRPFIRNIG